MKLFYLKVTNFKSIDTLEIKNPENFSVFLGANGSGKSNIFQAIEFVSLIFNQGLSKATRSMGGYHDIHSYKRKAERAKKFKFEIEIEINQRLFKYSLSANIQSSQPFIESEQLKINAEDVIKRHNNKNAFKLDDEWKEIPFNKDRTLLYLAIGDEQDFYNFISNIFILRVNPTLAKEPSPMEHSDQQLLPDARNLASVLEHIQSNKQYIYEDIVDALGLVATGIEKVTTERQKLDGKTALLFKEEGSRKQYPSHLISDGTLYYLSQLALLLNNNSHAWLLIEEPERGLHPKAIQELIEIMKEVSKNNLIWINSHNETIARMVECSKIILVDKIQGKTQIKFCRDHPPKALSNDVAWLSGFFGGGLPW